MKVHVALEVDAPPGQAVAAPEGGQVRVHGGRAAAQIEGPDPMSVLARADAWLASFASPMVRPTGPREKPK